jgi:DNA replication protein
MPYNNIDESLKKEKNIRLPETLFTEIIPQIQDLSQLKVILYVFYSLAHQTTSPPFITRSELISSGPALLALPNREFLKALQSAVKHGAFLFLKLADNQQDIYLANTISNRNVIEQIKRGEYILLENSNISTKKQSTQKSHNIFILYEQNIGMLTPMLSDELKAAAELYPANWIEDAFKEAVLLNKRSWRYIARILERWAREGKNSGAYRQGNKKDSADKYIRGKYGHLVKR